MERFVRSLLAALVVLLLAACAELQIPLNPPDAPETAPIPRLETGGHTARINRIAVDRAGRWLVTISHDKSARIWDLQSGNLVQVLRQSIGSDSQEGKLFAVAISPDGNTVAVSGYTTANANGYWIYLFDRAKGTLSGVLGGLTDAPLHLAWSPDGHRLAAMLSSDGLRIYDPVNKQEIYADHDYRDQSYSADFAVDGRLITTSWDGYLRLYRPAGDGYVRDEPVSAPGGRQPYAARFSPDGKHIALGYADSTRVDVLNAKTLQPLSGYAQTTEVRQGNLGNVAWSRDGRILYAGGSQAKGQVLRQVLRWPNGGRGPSASVGVATDTILDLIALADGELAFSTAEPTWGILNRDGRVRRHTGGPIADFRNYDLYLRVNATGTSVEFTYSTTTADLTRLEHTACFDFVVKSLAADECLG